MRALRVPALSATAALALLGGCDRPRPDMDPPRRVQLRCTPAVGGAPLVFVLDTGRRDVVWANGPEAPIGALTVSPHAYDFVFKAPAVERAWTAEVNRYDGRMTRRVEPGPPPGPEVASPPPPPPEAWACAPQTPGPAF